MSTEFCSDDKSINSKIGFILYRYAIRDDDDAQLIDQMANL